MLDEVCSPDPSGDPNAIRASVHAVRVATLGTLSGAELCGGGDGVAGELARLRGRFDQVGLFAMVPDVALSLLRACSDLREPLDAYVEIGQQLVTVVGSALDPLGVAQEGPATLCEDSVIASLLRTHAPSDTAVVAVSLAVSRAFESAPRPASLYLLADPKPFVAALAAA